ncbi:MazG nucleotide pyrophosphohydrolase domain-containing protein [Geoglobus acetivorans]|uniref:Nucleotide pyrophosphohydrolase n=1 Tax=Geoglobus acetivorans TaxID=565033 RepID=A0ABZ3H4W7_GEOAI|nr:nucleotide pyrophosphohydrolase [Geoglobus acetivorans]
MELAELAKKISEKYGEIDRKSGPLFLLSVFFEEAGELAEAVRKKDAESIEEELADNLFMILSLANYFNVDVERKLIEKYIENDPSGRWDLPS